MKITYSKKNIKYSIVFIVLLFLMCYESFTSISIVQTLYQHIDELVVIILLLYIFINIKTALKYKVSLIRLWSVFILLGFVSSLVFHYQGILPSFIDAILVISKFVIGYIGLYVYCVNHKDNIADKVAGCARIISLMLFLIALHDIVMTPFFPKGDFRFFLYSLRLMFSHPTYLGATSITVLVLLGYTNIKNKNLIYMLMISFVALMTLRGKTIGAIMVYWVFYLTFVVFKRRKIWFIGIVMAIACFFIGYDQIQGYFVTTAYSPRLIMLIDSINLAITHFPLGTGFGTFASSIAADYYSPLYTSLGYEGNWGMGSTGSMFLTDSFWPCIIAQFGFFGILVFLLVIIYFVKACTKKLRIDRIAGFSMLMIMANMIINSLAETAFFNPASLLLFILFAIFETDSVNRTDIIIAKKEGES